LPTDAFQVLLDAISERINVVLLGGLPEE